MLGSIVDGAINGFAMLTIVGPFWLCAITPVLLLGRSGWLISAPAIAALVRYIWRRPRPDDVDVIAYRSMVTTMVTLICLLSASMATVDMSR